MQPSQHTFSIRHFAPQSGFTLMELLVTVSIIAILASIAIPSYRRYTIMNAENQAQAKMKQLQIELESWRANSLTYKGFQPRKFATDTSTSPNQSVMVYAYDDCPTNTQITIPSIPITKGSSDPNAQGCYTATTNPPASRYIITLQNTNGDTLSPSSATTIGSTAYNEWRMLAVPQGSLVNYGAKRILLTSKGLACQSVDGSFGITATCTETGATRW